MTDRAPFPDVVVVLLDLLEDLASTDTVAPSDLQVRLPFIRVNRHGGGDDGFTDVAQVDIDTFGGGRTAAWTLAEAVRQRLLSGPHVVGTVTLDHVATSLGPNEIPWDNPKIWRFSATYTVAARR